MSTSRQLRFSEVREQAEEMAATMEYDGGLSRKDAESEVKVWALREHGVTLGVIADAGEMLPLSGLSGRVFWPLVVRPMPALSRDEILDSLEIAACKARNRHESKLNEKQSDLFQDAILKRLAAEHGIEVPSERLICNNPRHDLDPFESY